MIGLDTNVLVRYLAQDDAKQAAAATRLVETNLSVAEPGFIGVLVLAELCRVLKRLYGASPDEVVGTVEDLLSAPQFHIERREAVQAAIQRVKSGKGTKAAFVDALIAETAKEEGCSRTVSFDRAAIRSAGMTLLA